MLVREIDLGPIRPPSEGGSNSLLIRATRNCPWNRCTFCYGSSYNHEKFQLRTVEEIKRDIDTVGQIKDMILEASIESGSPGTIDGSVLGFITKSGKGITSSPTFATVFYWLASGGKTVFLQDADSLIMKTPQLIEVLDCLKKAFPSIERITSYARAKTAFKKSAEELKELKEAGLTRLHVGLETGDDSLLKKVNKGITAQEQIGAGRKVINAGMELSLYVMPGLGGLDLSMEHARHTAQVLNEINPAFIRFRPFVPRPGTPMLDEFREGTLRLLSPHSIIREIGMLVSELTVRSRICFDHALNPCWRSEFSAVPLLIQAYDGYQLPERKEEILNILDKGLSIDETKYIRSEDLIYAML
jgi:radical SAM superfamily enzyme YgiQ (UPF0313 family)